MTKLWIIYKYKLKHYNVRTWAIFLYYLEIFFRMLEHFTCDIIIHGRGGWRLEDSDWFKCLKLRGRLGQSPRNGGRSLLLVCQRRVMWLLVMWLLVMWQVVRSRGGSEGGVTVGGSWFLWMWVAVVVVCGDPQVGLTARVVVVGGGVRGGDGLIPTFDLL